MKKMTLKLWLRVKAAATGCTAAFRAIIRKKISNCYRKQVRRSVKIETNDQPGRESVINC